MSFMLILAMFFAVMPNSVVRADGIDIDKNSVDENSESVWSGDEFGLNYDIPTGTYGSIVIPATEVENPVPYHLTIAGTEVTATSVEIQSGATLHIFDGETGDAGSLSCSNITAQDGARMELGSSSNIPAGIQVYDIFYDEESGEDSFVDISGDEEWEWFTFVYDGNEGKWIVEPNEYDSFGGTEEKPVVIEVAVLDYDLEGEGFPIHFPADIPEEDLIDGWDRMKARVSTETASIELSWDAVNTPNQICVDGAGENGDWLIYDVREGETSYTLELNQGDRDFYCVEFKYGTGEPGSEESSYSFERLQSELDQTYFAFGDINNSGTVDEADLKYGVMRTLYEGFRVNEGRYQREGAALGLIEDFNKQDSTNLDLNMAKLVAFVTEVAPLGDSITATDKSGTSHTFDAYEVKITINQLYEDREDLKTFPDENGSTATPLEEPIILTAKVYLLNMTNSSEQVIIKVKDSYFVRDAYSERGNGSEPENKDDLENFEGLNARALIIVADFDSVDDIVLFGNYAQANEAFSDETSDSYYAAGFGTGDGMKFLGDKFIVYKPDFMGVTINGTGETKTPLAWSVESSLSIAETGRNENKNTETDIYFGFSSVEIAPVTSDDIAGLSVAKIQSVEVLDGIPENAVKIEDTDGDGKYTIHFLSDYYDTVRIRVTYKLDDNTADSGIMTLNRVGIMIQGGMTAGDSHTVNIFHGHEMGATLDDNVYDAYKAENTDKQHGDYGFAYYATYYYPTSSLATSADVSLFVTYTYADGSVERKLLESDYFTAATGENVAMSDYILYMGDGSNAPVKVETIAVPNANPDGTINGAKLGAGKGVEKTFNFND
ncbi:MAG: hypothetical protein ACI4AQ_06525 [Lachnospiraceae bacterium]